MKIRPRWLRETARVSLWDLVIVVLALFLCALLYSKGYADPYLPAHLTSEVVMATPEVVVAPEPPSTERDRVEAAIAAEKAANAAPFENSLPPSSKEEETSDATALTPANEPAPAETSLPPPSTPAAPLTLSTLERRFLPRDVRLLKATDFPIVFNGRVAGQASLPPGTAVRLVSVQGDQVTVKNGEASVTLPAAETDLLQQAETIRARLHSGKVRQH